MNTLLIDSQQIESGEALDKDFRRMAEAEFDLFRREKAQREGAVSAEAISDSDLLREVMNILPSVGDQLLWYAKSRQGVKFRSLLRPISSTTVAPKELSMAMDRSGRVWPRSHAAKHSAEEFRLLRTNTAVSPEESKTLTIDVEFMDGQRLF